MKFSTAILSVAALLAMTTSAHSQVSAQSQTTANGTYIASDPLANVRYDNRYDISVGMAYVRFMPGPNIVHGDNIGGLDLSGSYWLTRNLGIEGSERYYLGTAGAPPAAHQPPYSIDGPFVSQNVFVAGPEWLGPHNKHGAFIAHAMFGGAYGNFEQDLRNTPRSLVGFYSNGIAPAAVIGGHIDLNRSPQWVFRITPDALWTRYSTNYAASTTVPAGSYNNWNFGISVGVEYKFKKKR
jgi:hypothetical protein